MIKIAGAVSWWGICKCWTDCPSSLGAPRCHWGWLYKCSNHHQTFPQIEIDTWSTQRSLHYHICLFGSIFKYIILLYYFSSFMFSGMQRLNNLLHTLFWKTTNDAVAWSYCTLCPRKKITDLCKGALFLFVCQETIIQIMATKRAVPEQFEGSSISSSNVEGARTCLCTFTW